MCPPVRQSLAGQRAGTESGPYKISRNTIPNWESYVNVKKQSNDKTHKKDRLEGLASRRARTEPVKAQKSWQKILYQILRKTQVLIFSLFIFGVSLFLVFLEKATPLSRYHTQKAFSYGDRRCGDPIPPASSGRLPLSVHRTSRAFSDPQILRVHTLAVELRKLLSDHFPILLVCHAEPAVR